MCKVLRVSRSSYYSWLKRIPSKRQVENKNLTEMIKEIHAVSKQTYGSPRVTVRLKELGYNASRPRVARLMKASGTRSILRKKYVVTTDSKHDYKVVGNHLNRDFSPGKISRAWVSDITYIRTKTGWAYLTTIIDLGDRKVIGWSISKSLKAKETIVPAWNRAVRKRAINGHLIFHSDRGVQYACAEFTEILSKHSTVLQSMSRKGNCWDNAVAESFFKTLKTEWANRFVYQNQAHAELSLFEYIETYYNTRRLHSALGYMSPEQYSIQLNNNKQAA